MPRSFKTKPVNIQAGRDEGPNKLRAEAAQRKLEAKSKPIKPVGRRGNSRDA